MITIPHWLHQDYLPRRSSSPNKTSMATAKIIPKGLNIEQKRGPVFHRHHVLNIPRNTEETIAFIWQIEVHVTPKAAWLIKRIPIDINSYDMSDWVRIFLQDIGNKAHKSSIPLSSVCDCAISLNAITYFDSLYGKCLGFELANIF